MILHIKILSHSSRCPKEHHLPYTMCSAMLVDLTMLELQYNPVMFYNESFSDILRFNS